MREGRRSLYEINPLCDCCNEYCPHSYKHAQQQATTASTYQQQRVALQQGNDMLSSIRMQVTPQSNNTWSICLRSDVKRPSLSLWDTVCGYGRARFERVVSLTSEKSQVPNPQVELKLLDFRYEPKWPHARKLFEASGTEIEASASDHASILYLLNHAMHSVDSTHRPSGTVAGRLISLEVTEWMSRRLQFALLTQFD